MDGTSRPEISTARSGSGIRARTSLWRSGGDIQALCGADDSAAQERDTVAPREWPGDAAARERGVAARERDATAAVREIATMQLQEEPESDLSSVEDRPRTTTTARQNDSSQSGYWAASTTKEEEDKEASPFVFCLLH